MKLIKKYYKGKKFSNTPTGRAMQRQYDKENGIAYQRVLPEVEVFPNYYDVDNNSYGNSFAIPLESRPAVFSQGEISQPYVPERLVEQGWLNRLLGIRGLDLGILNWIINPANVVPTSETIQLVDALAQISRGNPIFKIENQLAPKTVNYTLKAEPRARLDFLERNPSKISEAERAGIPKADRNFKKADNPDAYLQQEANESFANINNHSPRRRLITEEEISQMPRESQIHAREGKNNFLKRNQDMMEDYFTDSSEFNRDLQDYINGLDIEIAPQFKPVITDGIAERNPYVAAYRNYLYNNGTDAMMISDDDIAKFLTHMHNMQQQGVTGKMADKLPLWHSSNDMFDIFDWHNTGKYTGNSGALGPGNYFSSHGATYGKLQRRNNLPTNFQPYYITGIESTPSGHMMINKGILPDYMGPQMFKTMKQNDPKRLEEILFRPVPGANTSLYIDSGEAVQGVFDGDRAAFMLRRNDGIKSLFPHPSRLIRNEDGTVQLLPTNWSDPRVNFALGGKLIQHIGK